MNHDKKVNQEKKVNHIDGLTHAEILIAAKNVGINLECGGCASEFYTGHSEAHDEHCTRGGKIYPSLSIEGFVRELLNNPPGLNGVRVGEAVIGNAHVDHGWKAALVKVLEFVITRGKVVILDEASEVTPEMWDVADKVVESSTGLVSVISTEEGPDWAAEVSAGYNARQEDNGILIVEDHPISVEILEETFCPLNTTPFTTKGQLIGPSLFSMVCLQDFKEGTTTPKKTWVACERPREVIHYDGVDYKYVGVSDGRMFYVREGK